MSAINTSIVQEDVIGSSGAASGSNDSVASFTDKASSVVEIISVSTSQIVNQSDRFSPKAPQNLKNKRVPPAKNLHRDSILTKNDPIESLLAPY